MIKSWILVTFFIAFNWSAAQSYTNYSEKDGLPSNHVYKITQDSNGFIWIATDEGLVKYNGTDFKVFTTQEGLPTNDIWNIFPAEDGKLWYIAKSTSMGYILDNVVHNFVNKEADVSIDPIYSGFTGDSLILSGTFRSHNLNSDFKWEEINYNIHKDYSNVSYLSHKKYKGIVRSVLDNDRLNLVTRDNNLQPLQDSLFTFDSHSRGQLTDSLYVGNSKNSYGFIDFNNLETRRYTYESELNVPFLKYSRLHLANNNIQLTGEHVVAILDDLLKVKEVVQIPIELKSHYSFIDKENTVWIATFSNGIYKHSINENRIKEELKHFKIVDIKRINNKIIALVNEKGFYQLNEKTNTFQPYMDSNDFLYDAEYIKKTNTSHFITKKNIFSITKNDSLNLKFDLVNERARSMTFYKGFIYGHYTVGINKIAPYSLEKIKPYSLSGVRCSTTMEDRLIFGGSNGLYELVNDKITGIESLTNFKKPVIDIASVNDKTLIVSTSGYGVYQTDLKTITLLEGSEFLKSNNPCISENQLYLSTNKGIYYYEFIDGKYQFKHSWNNTNGLPTDKINGIEKVNNELLVATNQGIIHYPIDYVSSQNLIDIYVDQALYASHDLKLNNHTSYIPDSDLQLVINNIDYRVNKKMYYEFRLLPTQKKWTVANSSNLTFSDLSPGEYNLELRSEGINKSFNFQLEPRWYQSWWFYLMTLLTVVTLIILVTKALTKRSEEKKNRDLLQAQKLSELQLKALRSQMNPHFVFNSLTAIQYYINENDFETSDRYLVKFSRLIREFFELSKEQHITIEREIELLKNYLDLESLRFNKKLNYNIEVDPDLNLKDIIPSMLLQPIVENAVNHGIFNKSVAGLITVKFIKLDEKQIQIHIIDDGVGFKFKKDDVRYKSSSVLEDRLRYLKASGLWEIELKRGPASSDIEYPGHEVIFNLKKLNDENL
ncbi:sensor histidine kinase [Nonlabens ulvanivorans]|uniref:sensor histidine kinase n=1 Tax=Nonlabens ulvanivorans TaxID=906888 RepID=UPI002942C137|nr:histidine kinase [Nonlabens ulvanivorans]WOI23292.1 histidine kinase [Nonlabens ulvanivorans]